MNQMPPVERGIWSTIILIAGLLTIAGLMAIYTYRTTSGSVRNQEDEMLIFPGFTVAEQPAPATGLIVTSLRTGSEAEKEGIAVGDQMLAIDLHPVKNVRDAIRILRTRQGDIITLKLDHNHSPHDIRLHRNEDAARGT